MLAKAIELTANRKVGLVSVTMAAQASCPTSCPFLKAGCYAESGPQGIHTARLNKAAIQATPEDIARAEAAEIDKLTGTRPLRLHVVGDCKTVEAVSLVANATARYTVKHNQPIWGYTHAWRGIPQHHWGPASILASCESTAEVEEAQETHKYATALVVHKFKSDKAWEDGLQTFIPCPEQTGKTKDCTTCKLCWDEHHLWTGRKTIVFETHGSRAKTANLRITEKHLCAPVS